MIEEIGAFNTSLGGYIWSKAIIPFKSILPGLFIRILWSPCDRNGYANIDRQLKIKS